MLNGFINDLKMSLKGPLTQILDEGLKSQNWEDMEGGVNDPNPYVLDTFKLLKSIVENLKGTINKIYFTKALNTICQATSELYIETILSIKKISQMGAIQLLCGKKSD